MPRDFLSQMKVTTFRETTTGFSSTFHTLVQTPPYTNITLIPTNTLWRRSWRYATTCTWESVTFVLSLLFVSLKKSLAYKALVHKSEFLSQDYQITSDYLKSFSTTSKPPLQFHTIQVAIYFICYKGRRWAEEEEKKKKERYDGY